ncbi:MAG: hypothetical protein ACPGVF_05135 [Flavobacteriaceae bacterium]
MKKVIFLIALFIVASCGVQKQAKAPVDPYLGVFNITVLNVDGYGDIPIELTVTKENDAYKASFNEDTPIEIIETNFANDQLEIDTYAQGYDILFEIKVEGDAVTGYMMGTFDIEGQRATP